MINIGLSTWSFLPLPPFEAVDKILKLGFDCIELWGDAPHFWPGDYLNSPLLKKLKDKLSNFKGPNSIHAPIVNLADKNPGLRKEALKQIKETIFLANKLNLKHITLHPGETFSMQNWSFDKVAFQIIIESLKESASLASKSNIFLCLENAPCNFGFESSQMQDIMKLINPARSPKEKLPANSSISTQKEKAPPKPSNGEVKITFDIAHANLKNQSSINFLKENYTHIIQIHLSDNSGTEDSHLPLGEGDIDFSEIFEYLKKHSFSGNIIGEFAWKKEGQIKVAREYIEYLNLIFRDDILEFKHGAHKNSKFEILNSKPR